MIDRSTLAAIHVAKKDLGLHDDDYRAMLKREAGVASARDLDGAGARRVMLWFENHGFAGTKSRRGTAGDRRPIVQKARALWISLWQLDEVADRRDSALDAFARNVTGKDTLHFATNGEAGKVVEALKAWAQRIGWADTTLLKLVLLQTSRLEAADPALAKLFDLGSNPDLTRLSQQLGVEMRRLQLGHRHRNPSQPVGA